VRRIILELLLSVSSADLRIPEGEVPGVMTRVPVLKKLKMRKRWKALSNVEKFVKRPLRVFFEALEFIWELYLTANLLVLLLIISGIFKAFLLVDKLVEPLERFAEWLYDEGGGRP